MDLQRVKQRYGIVGNSDGLNHALDVALQVAPTDLSVLIQGESGVGKEHFPRLIHDNSIRKHGKYFAVNCGSIPEGTIDSELFGHMKGSFTGAVSDHVGYFEAANGGTLFLDEVGELPMSTQARLLRVLETGEFIRVGSSEVRKTNVRIVAATNVNMQKAIVNRKFREDLYYRLNTIPIQIPALRERKEDIPLLFRKFAGEIAEKYNMPPVRLVDEAARQVLVSYKWPGNIRQLKNITEQISILERTRELTADILLKYIPKDIETTDIVYVGGQGTQSISNDVLVNMVSVLKNEIDSLKKEVNDLKKNQVVTTEEQQFVGLPHQTIQVPSKNHLMSHFRPEDIDEEAEYHDVTQTPEPSEVSFNLKDNEKALIIRTLKKCNGRRKEAAKELGFSERTLYRKIRDYGLD